MVVSKVLRVAFLGNSILYFNDCPRLLESMIGVDDTMELHQDSCLRGGANLGSLLLEGNGMQEKFAGEDKGSQTVEDLLCESSWDYVVMNDYTQNPARAEGRASTVAVLRSYAELFKRHCPKAVPVFLQTAAYRRPTKGSEDLGSVEEFTRRLFEGYQEYVHALKACGMTALIAPVGNAFLAVYHENREMWSKLFYVDDLHPSPHGSFLEACVLHWTITGRGPPVRILDDVPSLWSRARYMQRPAFTCPLPTKDEAEYLMGVAARLFSLA